MTMDKILELAGVPILIFVVCVYYGLRLIISQDASAIRGKGKEVVRDEKEYAKGAGKLLLFFGGATLVMAGLLLINTYLAVGEIIICTVIMGILWKRMNDKYGA